MSTAEEKARQRKLSHSERAAQKEGSRQRKERRDALAALIDAAPHMSHYDWLSFSPEWRIAYEAAKDLCEDRFRFTESGRKLPSKLSNIGILGAMEIVLAIGLQMESGNE